MKKEWVIPAAIILAGIIIAVTVYVVRGGRASQASHGDPINVAAVTPTDHIIGRPDAPILIIEYSDIDCAFCKTFQATMEQIMTDYGPGGNVAWVYRHFPFQSLNRNSELHAEAAECVAAEAGPAAFWHFIDALQQTAPGDNQFDPNAYDSVLGQLSIPSDAFHQCMSAHTYAKLVQTEFTNALAAGAQGTPYTVILVRGGKAIPIQGALPYASMKKVIDTAISKVVAK